MIEPRVDYATVRPPVAALQDRQAAARFRDSVFPATAWSEPAMRLLNLGGATHVSLAAITELLAPIIRGLAARSYGNLALGIVTSDEPLIIWLKSMVAEHKAPIFLAASVVDAPRAMRSSGALTPSDTSALDALINGGGSTTASDYASKSGLEAAAASNRLASLERKGFVFRVARSRRDGDLYIDPGSRWETQAKAIPAGANPKAEAGWRVSVADAAAATGRDPEVLLAEAWRAYLESNMESLNAQVAEARRSLEAGSAGKSDEEGLADWAAAAAQRMRDG